LEKRVIGNYVFNGCNIIMMMLHLKRDIDLYGGVQMAVYKKLEDKQEYASASDMFTLISKASAEGWFIKVRRRRIIKLL